MTHRVIITFAKDYIAISSSYPPRPGEDWERGNDIIDGHGQEIWNKLDDLLCYLKANPDNSADDWKESVLRGAANRVRIPGRKTGDGSATESGGF